MGWRFEEVVPSAEENTRLVKLATDEMMACLNEVQRAGLAARMLEAIKSGKPVVMDPWEWFDGQLRR